MSFEDMDSLIKRAKTEAEKLAKPLDLAGLEKQGIISKAGAWYRVHKFDRLPEHALARICEFTNDQKGLKVKFSKRNLSGKLARRLQKD